VAPQALARGDLPGPPGLDVHPPGYGLREMLSFFNILFR
jgi:hypothetical protein